MSLILSGTDGLSDVDGSAATPAVRGTDANTGIFFPAADTIAFSEGGVEAMRIDSSGNVGIGTSSPSAKLHVSQANTSVGVFFNGTTRGLRVGFDTTGSIIEGVDNTGVTSFQPLTVGGVDVRFTTSGTECMRIDSSGNLLVGRTSQLQTEKFGVTSAEIAALLVGTNTANVATLQIRRADTDGDAVTFFRGTTQKGYITVSSTGTTYNTLSDYRLKENIAPMVSALEKVAALKPVTYDWKDIGKTGQGFIAHELKEVVPECVTGEKDAVDEDGNPLYQGIDTSFLVATLTAAIQEQQALITALTERITALETP
jgi:hypothetical protein